MTEQESKPMDDKQKRYAPPSYGITQIDGKPATSVRFERTERDNETRYNLAFMLDSKSVERVKGLNDQELDQAVGVRNAESIRGHDSDKGSLKGAGLQHEFGQTPAEKERLRALENPQEKAEQERFQEPHEPVLFNPGPARGLMTGQQAPEIEAKIAEFQAGKRLATDQELLSEIDRFQDSVIDLAGVQDDKLRSQQAQELAHAHLAAFRKHEQTPYEYAVAEAIVGSKAASVEYREAIEQEAPDHVKTALNAAEVSIDRAIDAKEDRKSRDFNVMSDHHHEQAKAPVIEPEPANRIDNMDALAYLEAKPVEHKARGETRYEDRGDSLGTQGGNHSARDLVEVAQERGWQNIHIHGDPAFRREAWKAATEKGIEVSGYEPTEKEKTEATPKQEKAKNIEVNPKADAVRTLGPSEYAKRFPELAGVAAIHVTAEKIAERLKEPTLKQQFMEQAKARLAVLVERGASVDVSIKEARARERDTERERDMGR